MRTISPEAVKWRRIPAAALGLAARTLVGRAFAQAALVVLLALLSGCHKDSEAPHEHPTEFPPAGTSIAIRFDGKSIDLPLASMAPDGG